MSLQTITPPWRRRSASNAIPASSSRTCGRTGRRKRRACGSASPAVGRRPGGGEPADRQLLLPAARFRQAGGSGGPGRQDEKLYKVTPVEQSSDSTPRPLTTDPERNLVAPLGIIGVEIDPRLAAGAKGLRDPYGIIVAARAAGAVAEIPLLPRDIIRSLNNEKTTSLVGLRRMLSELKPGAPVTLQIQREGRLMFVSFTME